MFFTADRWVDYVSGLNIFKQGFKHSSQTSIDSYNWNCVFKPTRRSFYQDANRLQPAIFNNCFLLSSGSQGSAGASPSCHRAEARVAPWTPGGSRRTWGEPTLTQREAANSTQEGLRPEIKPTTFLLRGGNANHGIPVPHQWEMNERM